MISPQKLLWIAASLAVSNTLSAAVLYDIDFQLPEVGIYSTVFGAPTIQPSVGPFNNALVFRAEANYNQISLPIEVAAPIYGISFDVLTHGLENSLYAFTILLDTPQVRHFSFHGLYNAVDAINQGQVSPFSDDQTYHWDIVADFPANRLSLTIDGGETFTTTIDASGLGSVRFAMSPWRAGAGDAPGTYAALDNVIVTAVPEPSFGLLSLTSLLVVGLALKRANQPLDRTTRSVMPVWFQRDPTRRAPHRRLARRWAKR